MKRIIIICLYFACFNPVFSQHPDLSFSSSDSALQTAFYRAREMALHYKGNPGDPVGPWYESALPPRYAFCMRDVAHQALPAEILGMGAANKNMFTLFVKNISASKDWCSYWEINKWGKPAPADYRNDTAFWYNLPANFDILNACWNLYLWTGDKNYTSDPVFENFFDRSANEYIESWTLQADSLLSRPAHPNAGSSFNINDDFHRCRGLPSYSEGVRNMKVGIDLVAAIYRGLLSYAEILKINGKETGAKDLEIRAVPYREHIDTYWWDEAAGRYNTFYSNSGTFGKNEGETFLLWFDALTDSNRKKKTVEHILAGDWNVENMSYFPYILYKNGYWDEALHYIRLLTDTATRRREYPEVSYGVILGFTTGLMGIQPDARFNRVQTIYKTGTIATSSINNVPLLGTMISVTHSLKKTGFSNTGKQPVIWRAAFYGLHDKIMVDGKIRKTTAGKDEAGNSFSYVDVKVNGGKLIAAVVE
jgi:hypothetical protein